MNIHYVKEENIFVAIVYRLLVKQKNYMFLLCFETNGKEIIKMHQKTKYDRFKNYKKNHHL